MNKRLHFLFTLIFLITVSKSFSANIIIKYIINKDSLFSKKHRVSDKLLGITNNQWDILDVYSRQEMESVKTVLIDKPSLEVVIIKYKISRDGVYFLKDLFGHEIFLTQSMSGDTILLILDEIFRKNEKHLLLLNDSTISPWFFKITYPEKYKYMGFFDSLAYLHGDLRSDFYHSYTMLGFDLTKYLAVTNKIYSDRLKFYYDFARSFNMPVKIKYYALQEIQYRYYDDLMNPLVLDYKVIEKFPANIKDTINSIRNNYNDNELFENISLYRTVINNYVITGFEGFSAKDKVIPDSNYIINRMKYCKSNLKGESQGYVLAFFMRLMSMSNTKKNMFALLYNNYDHTTSAPGVNKYVDSLNDIVNKSGNISPDEVLSLIFEDSSHNKRTLKEVFNKDIILMDCWATWCIPCRKQTPYLDSLAEEYKNRVQFISLSADQFINKWDSWLLNSMDKNDHVLQLHAANGFDNIFFRWLMITAIPRYILFSKSGNLLNLTMPYPSSKDDFKKEIDHYLK